MNLQQIMSPIRRAIDDYKMIDDGDKIAIITNRMKQLIQNYVQNHACCVGSVSEEDNDRACSLILRYKK